MIINGISLHIYFQALRIVKGRPTMNTQIDCISSRKLLRLPGFIDVHVHMREPGATHKETWSTGSMAALAGGITLLLAMPNTNPACIDLESLTAIDECASKHSYVDYGLYLGGTTDNAGTLDGAPATRSVGLKLYLNETFSTLRLDNVTDWIKVCAHLFVPCTICCSISIHFHAIV